MKLRIGQFADKTDRKKEKLEKNIMETSEYPI